MSAAFSASGCPLRVPGGSGWTVGASGGACPGSASRLCCSDTRCPRRGYRIRSIDLRKSVNPAPEEPCAGRSGRQDCNPAGGNPAVSIAQFGHVAIPHPVRVTVREYAWCKRPGRPESFRLSAVGATWGPSERGSLKRSEWLQPRKYGSLLKLHCRDSFVCRARFRLCEAEALWEEMGACTGRGR